MNKYLKSEDIPVCLNCIHCKDTVTENFEQVFYCEENLFDRAPHICWNCYELVTEDNLPF